MKAKKFNSVFKKFSKILDNGENWVSHGRDFFKLTGNERFLRVADAMSILGKQISFVGEEPAVDPNSIEVVFHFAKIVFTQLIRKELEKTFTLKQLEEIEKIKGGIYLVHYDDCDTENADMEKFWKAFYIAFINNPHKKNIEWVKKVCDEEDSLCRLSYTIGFAIAHVMHFIAELETELFGTKIFENEFVKGFKNILKKAMEEGYLSQEASQA